MAVLAAALSTTACAAQPSAAGGEIAPAVASDAQVVVYVTEWCPHCRRARQWLRAEGVSFVELDVDADPRAARMLRQLNPMGGVPTFDVDGEVLVGFAPGLLRRALQRAERRRYR
jgi:glutaredoxin